MSEMKCPKTGAPCPRGSLCADFSQGALDYVELQVNTASAEYQELAEHATTVGPDGERVAVKEFGYVVNERGKISSTLGKPWDKEAKDGLPDLQYILDLATAAAHEDIRKALTFPEGSVTEGEPYDEYYQRDGIICLRGVYRATSRIFNLPQRQQRRIISGLLGEAIPEGFKLETLFGYGPEE